ncbi:hypothetical protein BRADI_5g17005v3 [Brachypodium distachyon]|uniref:Uncharacterized protein n=1 Tax=Brachypodium distachyon TaxID=15368 RepID=A0A0Q3P4T9_BRADI|nr:hypothetical protein BRADI_5g17005v3 [Brachypodium distachyon]
MIRLWSGIGFRPIVPIRRNPRLNSHIQFCGSQPCWFLESRMNSRIPGPMMGAKQAVSEVLRSSSFLSE